jgi:hypothetical protein
MMRRRTFLLAMCGTPLLADAQQQVFDLFTKIATALSAGDPTIFLDAVDHDMPHFGDLQRNLNALTQEADVSNNISVSSDSGDDSHRVEELDWTMQVVGNAETRPVEQREALVKFRLERRGKKKWKIISIDPLDFFAAPKVSP